MNRNFQCHCCVYFSTMDPGNKTKARKQLELLFRNATSCPTVSGNFEKTGPRKLELLRDICTNLKILVLIFGQDFLGYNKGPKAFPSHVTALEKEKKKQSGLHND